MMPVYLETFSSNAKRRSCFFNHLSDTPSRPAKRTTIEQLDSTAERLPPKETKVLSKGSKAKAATWSSSVTGKVTFVNRFDGGDECIS